MRFFIEDYPARARTLTNRIKICCATITLPGNVNAVFLDTVAQLGFTGSPVLPGERSVLYLSTSGKSFSERNSASLKFTERGLCLRLLTQPAVPEDTGTSCVELIVSQFEVHLSQFFPNFVE